MSAQDEQQMMNNTEVDTSVIMAGRLEEGGWIGELTDQFSKDGDCFAELFDNSDDWEATNIIIDESTDALLIGDNAVGMSRDGLIDMFVAYKPPKKCFRTGKFAIGSKAGQAVLSRRTSNKVITTTDGKEYNTAEPNWKKMIDQNKYSNNIPIRRSTAEEIKLFQYVSGHGSGTVFVFPKNKELTELVHSQFGINKESNEMDPANLWSVIYGPTDLNICYRPQKGIEYKLSLYNPRSANIIGTISEDLIQVYRDQKTGHTRFIIKEINPDTNELTEYEFSSTLKSCHTVIQKVTNSKKNYKYEGDFTFARFLPELNIPLTEVTGSSKDVWSVYDKKILGDRVSDKNMKKYNEKNHVIRNNLNIATSKMPRLDSRAGGEANLQSMIYCELRYNPESAKEEVRDKLSDMKGNKHRAFIEYTKPLQHLLEYLLEKKFKEIKEMRNNLTPSEIVITPKPKKDRKPRKAKIEPIVNGNSSEDDTSSIASTSSSSSNSNVKVGGGSSATTRPTEWINSLPADNVVDDRLDAIFDVMDAPMDPVNESENVVISIVDNDAAVGGGGSDIRSFFGGGSAAGKPSKRIDVPGHRKGLVTGEELEVGWNSLNINKDEKYDDPDYIALFNLIQKIKNKD